MEYMRGGNAKRLVEDPSYDALYYSEKWAAVVMLMGQMISTALETIHGAGFVHLDVKPQNILFTATPPPPDRTRLNRWYLERSRLSLPTWDPRSGLVEKLFNSHLNTRLSNRSLARARILRWTSMRWGLPCTVC